MRKKANCLCTLKGLVDLKLDDSKKNLMKNSQFYQFLNVKDKATSSFLVHRFLQCYKVAEKHFEVKQKVVTIDVSDIVRMTGLKASGDQYEKSKSRNIPSWYVDLVDKYPPPTKEKKAEKIKKEEAMEEKEEEKEEKKEEEEEKGKGEAEKKRTHKSTVSHVLRAMHKLLCYFLICFYVDAPAEDIGGYHHFADVDDLRKFEKICWAQVMLCNILDCAEKISSQSNRSYITCNSPVVEALVYDKLPDMFEVETRGDWKEGDIVVNKFEEKLWSNKSVMGHFAGENEQNKTEKKKIRGDSARKLIARIKATDDYDDDDDDDDDEEEEEEEEEEGGGGGETHRE
ncbi:hypothetical protein RDABS01_024473 [Bienertia sinuspersici]